MTPDARALTLASLARARQAPPHPSTDRTTVEVFFLVPPSTVWLTRTPDARLTLLVHPDTLPLLTPLLPDTRQLLHLYSPASLAEAPLQTPTPEDPYVDRLRALLAEALTHRPCPWCGTQTSRHRACPGWALLRA